MKRETTLLDNPQEKPTNLVMRSRPAWSTIVRSGSRDLRSRYARTRNSNRHNKRNTQPILTKQKCTEASRRDALPHCHEGALLNTHLRKGYLHNGLEVKLIGHPVDLSYSYEHLGETSATLENIIAGDHPFAKALESAKHPMVIISSNIVEDHEA